MDVKVTLSYNLEWRTTCDNTGLWDILYYTLYCGESIIAKIKHVHSIDMEPFQIVECCFPLIIPKGWNDGEACQKRVNALAIDWLENLKIIPSVKAV